MRLTLPRLHYLRNDNCDVNWTRKQCGKHPVLRGQPKVKAVRCTRQF